MAVPVVGVLAKVVIGHVGGAGAPDEGRGPDRHDEKGFAASVTQESLFLTGRFVAVLWHGHTSGGSTGFRQSFAHQFGQKPDRRLSLSLYIRARGLPIVM